VDKFSKGDLVRWVIGHATFEAHPDKLVGADPIYRYGIVMQVSAKVDTAIVVHSCGFEPDYRLIILDGAEDEVEVLSTGRRQHD